MKTSFFSIFAILWIVAGGAGAGPLAPAQVAEDANWVIHVDAEMFNHSGLGKLIRRHLADLGVEEKLANFARVYSFHPLNDVRDVTIYGRGADREQAVALIDGVFDAEELTALVRLNPEHAEFAHGHVLLHQWLHKETRNGKEVSHMMYGGLYRGNMVVMGAGLDAVKVAIDVLDGRSAGAPAALVDIVSRNGDGAIIRGAALGVSRIAERVPKAAVLKHADQLSLVVGQAQGSVYAALSLTAPKEESAQRLKKILDGLVAFAALAGEEHPALAALAEKMQVTLEQTRVEVRFAADSEAVFAFLREKWQEQQEQNQ